MCTKCGEEKDISLFYKDGSKYRSECIKCTRISRRHVTREFENIEDIEGEIWRDVNNSYLVSNKGRIKSKDRYNNSVIYSEAYFLKGQLINAGSNGNGYLFVILNREGVKKREYVHRLVAKAFIKPIKDKPFVNHINGIKSDNNVENLEWVNRSENQLHRYNILKKGNTQKGKPLINNYKSIIENDEHGEIVNRFNNLREASIYYHINYTTLSSILNGKRKLNKKINIYYENGNKSIKY